MNRQKRFGKRSYEMSNPLQPKKPRSCDLLISERCNLRCVKCHFWKSGVSDEISLHECKQIVDELSRMGDRPFEINLGGGEPLLMKGIIELVRYCAKKKLHVALSTNGTMISKEMAKRLAGSGLSRMSISLDSLNEKTHDMITGVSGSFAKVMKGIEYLGMYWKTGTVNIHTVLSALNVDDIIPMVEWVNRHTLFSGINIQAVAQPFRSQPVDTWYETEEYRFLWPQEVGRVHEVLSELVDRKKAGYKIINPLHQLEIYKTYYAHPEQFARKFRCNVGDYTVNVNALGLLHLCCFMKPLGSLRLSTVTELWQSPQAEETRYAMYNCRKSCNNIMNCFFEEEDKTAGFSDDVAVSVGGKTACEKQDESVEVGIPLLSFVVGNVTPLCKTPCRMCYQWKTAKQNKVVFNQSGMTVGEWRWTIRALREFSAPDMRFFVGGGEPMLFPGVEHVIRQARQEGFFPMIGTSAVPLTVSISQALADAGLRFISFSLDSRYEKKHDYFRGKRGVYKQVMKFARWFKRYAPHIDVGISCIITEGNISELLEFVSWVDSHEDFSSLYLQALVQPYDTTPCNYWYRLKEYSSLWPRDGTQVAEVFDALIAYKRAGKSKLGNALEQLEIYKKYYENPEEVNRRKQCLRKADSLSINWLGYVSYCDYLGPMGNVRDFTMAQILHSTVAHMRRAKMRQCDLKCNYIEQIHVD